PSWQSPVVGSHVSRPLQKTPSSQTTGCPVQLPLPQVSSVVHSLWSSQGAVLGLLTQLPVPGSQPSSVQTLSSSQFGGGPPTQLPFLPGASGVEGAPSLPGGGVGFAGVGDVAVGGVAGGAGWGWEGGGEVGE